MRKVALAAVTAPILLAGLVACGGSSTPSQSPLSVTPSPGAESANAELMARADAFCQRVDALVTKAQEATASPKTPAASTMEELSADAAKLNQEAQKLAGELIADPAATQKVTDCVADLDRAVS